MFGWLCRLCLAGGRRWRGALAAAGVIVMFGCGDDGVKSDNVLFPECGETDVVPRPGASVRVMVPMRDCTRLATNVILPDGPGPYPVIVVRTPYGRANSEFLPLPGIGEAMFAPHGYAVVEQDTRGRFNSEGRFVPYLVERDDTVDTLDWIARQPWFNGKLGVWGLSYLGLTAELAMVARPELVDAAVVGEIRSDFYGAAFERGNIRADTVGLWLLGLLDKHNLNFSTPQEQARAMLQFPLIDGDVRVVGENIDFIDVFAEHTFEDAFWTEDLSRAQLVATDIPVMMLDGWFDLFAEGMLDDWTALRVARGGRDQYIVVGPWTHLLGFVDQDFSFPNGGSIANFLDDMVAFFDRYLKGEKLAMPTARYYDGGLSRWRSGNALWPAATTTWNLYANLAATRPTCAGRAGTLSARMPATAAARAYVYDPKDPVILRAANILDLSGRDGMQIDNDWCVRDDAVVFETPPLAAPREIAGAMTAHLQVASDAPNTTFLARLSLVDADGTAYNLRESAALLSHRESATTPTSYTPGETVHVALPLARLRWTLQPGQRLRLVVTSSGYPFIAPHPNTGGDWLRTATPVTAVQTVHTGAGSRPTRLSITVAD